MDITLTMDRLRSVSTAQIADVFTALGIQGCMTGLRRYTGRERHTLVGPAVTVRFAPVRGDGSPATSIYEALEAVAEPGTVLVMESGGSPWAVWGELATRTAMGRQVAGLVLDGMFRDLADIKALEFPVFAAGLHPQSYNRRLEVVGVNVPLRCGGVQVRPGDLIVADDDGVAVIPVNLVPTVIRKIDKILNIEREIKTQIGAGKPMTGMLGLLRAKYADD